MSKGHAQELLLTTIVVNDMCLITKQKEPVKNKQSVDQSENAEEKSVDNNTSLYILLAILIILQIISFMY